MVMSNLNHIINKFKGGIFSMKKTIKVCSIILCLTMLLSFAAGCVKSDGGNDATQSDAPPTTVKKEGSSWTWDTTSWDMGVWYVGDPAVDKVWDPVNVQNDKVMFEKTGLEKVEFTVPASADQEKLNAMIAANMLPDVISIPIANNQERRMLLEESGYVLDLIAIAEQYAPTFVPEIPEDMIRRFCGSDGNLYGFPNAYTTPRGKVEFESPCQMFARTDIMDKLGLDLNSFETQDKMVESLKKFAASGIDQDGLSILPMIMTPIGVDTLKWIQEQSEYFGPVIEDKEGNYIHPVVSPKIKEMAQFISRLFREGLYTEQNIMMERAESEQIILNNRMFMHFGKLAAYNQKASRNVIFNSNGEITFTPLTPVKSLSGDEPEFPEKDGKGGYFITYISSKAKNIEKTIQFFEYLFSEEAQMLQVYGLEGVQYEWKEGQNRYGDSGKFISNLPAYSEEYNKDPVASTKKTGIATMWMLRDNSFTSTLSLRKPYEEETIQNQWDRDIKDFFRPYAYPNPLSLAFNSPLLPDAGTEEAEIYSKIKLFLDNHIIKLITAASDAEFESLYAEGIAHVEKLGLDKVVAVSEQKYLDGKKVAGVDYLYRQHQK